MQCKIIANQKTDVDELIKTHSDLSAKSPRQGMLGRTRHTTEIEDVMQIGFTGLVNAAQQYTRKEGATFATYASIRIKGAIIDYLRKSSNLCRTTIQIKRNIIQVIQGLQTKFMRQPTHAEIAAGMGMSEQEFTSGSMRFRRMSMSHWLMSIINIPSGMHLRKTVQKKN